MHSDDDCERNEPVSGVIFEFEIADGLIFHQLALILCAIFMCLAVLISGWLILDHALHYLRPYEQKHIIRILFMIPIYATFSFLSLLFYTYAVYFELVRNCYEAYVIASFFTLMCHYIAPSLHDQKEYFRNVKPKPWVFPLNKVKTPRSGLTWFNIIYACVFQFCFTRPLFTFIAGILQSEHRYCQKSNSPFYAHLWIVLLQGACVLVAMYCLIQFYTQLKADLAPHKPLLKVICIKLGTFIGFWQIWLLNLLSSKKGPLKHSKYIAIADIHIAIPCIMVSFEMIIFACAFHWAFPWRPYNLAMQLRGSERLEEYAAGPHTALLEALNPWDYWKAAARGFWWLVHGVRHRMEDASYRVRKEEDDKVDESEETITKTRRDRPSVLSDPGLANVGDGNEHGRLRYRRTVG